MVSEKSITSKLIHRYNPLKVKNKDNLIEAELLLCALNSTIGNLSNQSSC